jgi:superfamily II DNA or RNA helicase
MKIIVNNIYSQITECESPEIIKLLDYNLSYYVQGYAFTAAYKTGWWNGKKKKWERWDGKSHLLDDKLRFQTGLLNKVKSILSTKNIKLEIIDNRDVPKYGKKIKIKNVEERPYQKRVLDAALKHKNGLIKVATGGGKSVIINNLIAETNVKTMVYVIGIDLLYQMHETFNKMLGTEVGIIGDGKAEIKKINVCTVWTAANALGNEYVPFDDEEKSKKETINESNKDKIVKAIKEAEMVIYDECQMLAAKTLQIINNASKEAYYKYGFSGTPFRDDGADLLLEATCGKIIVEVSPTELIKDNYLVKPTIHFIDIPEYKGSISPQYPSIYKNYIVENEIRNDRIIKSAEKLVSGGRKVLILVKTIRHGEILYEKLSKQFVVYYVRGDVGSDERNKIRKDFISGKIELIIATAIYDQGVDIPNIDALILAGSGKSSGRALQRIGRVIRPAAGKKDAIVLDFIDNAKYVLDHSKKRIDVYKKETGFEIKLPKNYNESDEEQRW